MTDALDTAIRYTDRFKDAVRYAKIAWNSVDAARPSSSFRDGEGVYYLGDDRYISDTVFEAMFTTKSEQYRYVLWDHYEEHFGRDLSEDELSALVDELLDMGVDCIYYTTIDHEND